MRLRLYGFSCLGATRDVHGLGLGASAFPGFWVPFKGVM